MLRSVKTLPSAWEIRDCVITSLPLYERVYHKAGLAIMLLLLLLLSEECGSSAPCESHSNTTRASACAAVYFHLQHPRGRLLAATRSPLLVLPSRCVQKFENLHRVSSHGEPRGAEERARE